MSTNFSDAHRHRCSRDPAARVTARPSTKANPLLDQSQNERDQRRRSGFLTKVREGGERQRWRARGGPDEVSRSGAPQTETPGR